MIGLTILIEDEPLARLKEIAIRERRSTGFLVREAIAAYLADRDRQPVPLPSSQPTFSVPALANKSTRPKGAK